VGCNPNIRRRRRRRRRRRKRRKQGLWRNRQYLPDSVWKELTKIKQSVRRISRDAKAVPPEYGSVVLPILRAVLRLPVPAFVDCVIVPVLLKCV